MKNVLIKTKTDKILGKSASKMSFTVIITLVFGFLINLILANSLKLIFKNI